MKIKIYKEYSLKELLEIQKLIDSLDKEKYKRLIDFWENIINNPYEYYNPIRVVPNTQLVDYSKDTGIEYLNRKITCEEKSPLEKYQVKYGGDYSAVFTIDQDENPLPMQRIKMEEHSSYATDKNGRTLFLCKDKNGRIIRKFESK